MEHDTPIPGDSTALPFDVAVVGCDVPALVLAWECARYGFRVAVVDELPSLANPQEFVGADAHLVDLCTELGIDFRVRTVEVALSDVVGIPTNPFSDTVRARGGWSVAWRIYLDRIMPLLSIGNEPDMGILARKRLGRRSTQLFIAPRLRQLYGVDSVHVPIDEVAPGLSQAVSRVGSLTAGALELIVANPRWCEVVTIAGGATAVRERLDERLEYFAVTRVAPADRVQVQARFVVEDIACTAEFPSWSRQIERAKRRASELRHALLSDPELPPIGPVDLEH